MTAQPLIPGDVLARVEQLLTGGEFSEVRTISRELLFGGLFEAGAVGGAGDLLARRRGGAGPRSGCRLPLERDHVALLAAELHPDQVNVGRLGAVFLRVAPRLQLRQRRAFGGLNTLA